MNIWLPHLRSEPKVPAFDNRRISILRNNMEELRRYQGVDERIEYILSTFEAYQTAFRTSTRFVATSKSLHDMVGLDLDYSGESVERFDLSVIPKEWGEGEEVFFFSDSHASTYHVLKWAGHNENTAVLCFDAHADLMSDEEPLWKGNVFTKLISEGIIDSLVLVGVPEWRVRSIKRALPSDYAQRVLFASRSKQIARWLVDRGVRNIYLSFDIDVLRTQAEMLTATEYCPFTVLLNCSKEPFCLHSIIEAERVAEEIVRPRNLDGFKNLYHIGETGLSKSEAEVLVATIHDELLHHGLEIGLKTQSGLLLGEIVELCGTDLEYNASHVSLSILERWGEGKT